MKVTTIRFPESLYESLAAEAEERDKSVSEHVRDVLRARDESNTPGNTREDTPENTTADVEELRDRLDDVEQRLTRVERRSGGSVSPSPTPESTEYAGEHAGEYGSEYNAAESVEDAPDVDPREIDLPGSGERLRARQDAVREMYGYLRREGKATKSDFLKLVDVDAVGYQTADSFWSNSGADALADLPGVDRAGIGEHTWRYLNEDVTEE